MKKIKGIIDRFEGNRAVIRVDGDDLVVPKRLTHGFSEGDTVYISIADEKEDTENSREVAKNLLSEILKEE